jgi:hypothetical protein
MNSNPFRKIYLEALKGDQHKLDVDNDKRIEAEDLAKLRAKKMKKEETEQIDELDKKTLASYAYKAAGDATDKARESERRASSAKEAEKRAKDPKLAFAKSANQAVQKHEMGKSAAASKKSANRLSGVLKAASKLAYKEEVDLEEGSSKNDLPFDGPYTKTKPVKNSDGTIQSPMSRARELAKKALAAKKMKEELEEAKYNHDDNRRGFGRREREDDEYHVPDPEMKKNKVKKEEAELQEARINGREYASQGVMHPDHAKMDIHKVSDQHVDFYASKTGDKMQGKVVKNDGKSVHIQAHKELGDGKLHKFKITPNLPKPTNEETTMEFTQEELALIEQFIVIAEKMNMSKASMGDVIKDFKKSDAPQFKGKSMEKRREMAIAAKLSNEETESVSFKSFALDEIKMSDLPSRKVSGKYGTEYYKKEKEKDEKGYDADDEDTPSSEKRGRGRPKGSSSGARQKGSTPKKKGSGVEMTGYPLHLPNSK